MRSKDNFVTLTSVGQGIKALWLTLSVGLALTSSAVAQSIEDIVPDFTPEQANNLREGFGRYSSFVTVFTSRNGATSGAFSAGSDDFDFSVMSIPISYTFGEDSDELRFKVRGALGQFKSTESFGGFSDLYTQYESSLPPEFQGLPNQADFVRNTATSVTLGGGFEYRPTKKLLIEPAFDMIWTHLKQRWNYGNFMSALAGARYDRDVFNTSIEAMTYAPSIHALYAIDFGGEYELIPEITYTHLWSYDLWSKSRYADFNIDSGVLQSKVTVSIPLSNETFGRDVDLRPFVVRTDLYRAVKEAFGTSTLWDFGADVAVEVKDSWISEVRLGAAYIYSDLIEGYRINIGAEF
jgi:hypothetical protein